MHLIIEDTQKADIFSQLFQPIKSFTESINIHFKRDEVFVQCMDGGMIMIMIFAIPASWFSTYEIDEPETLGINTSMLSKVLSIKDKSQGIELDTSVEEDHLFVKFPTNNMMFEKTFNIPLIQLETDLLEIPDMDYSADFSLTSVVFTNMIQQLKQFGESMHIDCTEEFIELISESIEYGKMKTHIPIQDLDEYSIEEGKSITGSFALKNLSLICMYHKISKMMDISISDSYPLRIQSKIDDVLNISFYIAPRIED
tara:strand:- start:11 stop:778 length:768 start_codon:yes stop_codon:yes gene_type:complete